MSINHEGGTGTPEDAAFYEKLYDILNSQVAEKYWVKANGTVCDPIFTVNTIWSLIQLQLGTLGESRGKLTLLQRFSWSLLPGSSDKRFGIYLDAAQWTDNGKSIELTYNTAQEQVAYIEVPVVFI